MPNTVSKSRDLESIAGHLNEQQRAQLSKTLSRWSKEVVSKDFHKSADTAFSEGQQSLVNHLNSVSWAILLVLDVLKAGGDFEGVDFEKRD